MPAPSSRSGLEEAASEQRLKILAVGFDHGSGARYAGLSHSEIVPPADGGRDSWPAARVFRWRFLAFGVQFVLTARRNDP
jgi:hypothetical protein